MNDATEATDAGARALGVAVATHPTFAVALFGGLVGAIVTGSGAYFSVKGELSDHGKDIAAVKAQVADNERRSSDKLDGLSRDIGSMNVQIGRIDSSVQFLVRASAPTQQRGQQP